MTAREQYRKGRQGDETEGRNQQGYQEGFHEHAMWLPACRHPRQYFT